MLRFVYQYVFYRAYDLLSLTGKPDDSFSSVLLLTFFPTILIAQLLYVFNIYQLIGDNLKIFGIILILSIFTVNYVYFIYFKNGKKALTKFSKESKKQKLIGRSIMFLILLELIIHPFLR